MEVLHWAMERVNVVADLTFGYGATCSTEEENVRGRLPYLNLVYAYLIMKPVMPAAQGDSVVLTAATCTTHS